MAQFVLSADGVDELEAFRALLPDVRRYIRQHVPSSWPDLIQITRPLMEEPLGPLAVLPLASADAAGGDPREAIPIAAAWEVLSLAVRTLDDIEDGDRRASLSSAIGAPRAFNFCAGLYAFCNHLLHGGLWPAVKYRAINEIFIAGALRLVAGQDLDLKGTARTLEEYWRVMEWKNASAFSFVCAAGARSGTDDTALVTSCATYGHHLGLALQIFNDFEGLWEPIDQSDLAADKVTLPIVYGLAASHPRQEELQQLVADRGAAQRETRVREILDELHTREFLVWAALKERDQALAALSACRPCAGVTALTAYVTTLFARVEQLLPDRSATEG